LKDEADRTRIADEQRLKDEAERHAEAPLWGIIHLTPVTEK